ncbi:MAG: 2TM domain-containing protein [Bacteroidia bacterium]|nr:2TM domain-containing protein [Bacteroidia bacterium]
MDHYEIRQKARKRVKAKKIFFAHLLIYGGIMVFLFFINMTTSPGFPWFIFPVGGWGLFILIHFVIVFLLMGSNLSRWERKLLQKEMKRLGRNSNNPEDYYLEDDRYEELELGQPPGRSSKWNDKDFV